LQQSSLLLQEGIAHRGRQWTNPVGSLHRGLCHPCLLSVYYNQI